MKRRITSKKQAKHYIEILTDFGWKYYFGREENKVNLINFLNSLLEGEHVIADLHYANVEEDGDHSAERKVVFDLRCIGVGGQHFLVEMQLQNQDFFFDRAVTYTSRTISRLAKKGAELSTIMDQWMYLMRHLNEIDELPNYLDKRIFSRIFEVGEVANLTPAEHMAYISSLDRKKDYNNTIAYAKKEAMADGERKKALETALNLKKMDIPTDKIAKATGLSIEDVELLK